MIFKVIAFMIILSIFKEMDEAKEKKDLCDIVYWGVGLLEQKKSP